MTLQERVLKYLGSIAPQRATNSDIRHNLGVRHHPQIYQETQFLRNRGLIQGEQNGRDWEFWVDVPSSKTSVPDLIIPADDLVETETSTMDSRRFEAMAREVMGRHYGASLSSASVLGVPKRFDLVSANGQIVGDAKYFTLVGGERLPPAKFSVIAEYVWLLEKIDAEHRFLVFGNDRRVPEQWLARYGKLVTGIDFFFLDDSGQLKRL